MTDDATVWKHVPSCDCDRCEDYRQDNGMSCVYDIGRRPDPAARPHNWRGQEMLS